MSLHKVPLSDLEKSGLRAHSLPVEEPSQLSDYFRLGVAWALARADRKCCNPQEETNHSYGCVRIPD